jgi:poly(beta-D-mannuronate) lyase
MKRLLLLHYLLAICLASSASPILVKNIDELNAANKKAQPGDSIILQNGEWSNVMIKLDCNGTEEKPIVFSAQTAGKVLITGHSQLKLGGNHIIVSGLYFVNGYSGNDAVISFCINKDKLANYCTVTSCVINDFNNPKRMEENNWVLFYGKYNQLDHCSFINKKNMGVLIAVVLDDDRSRENYHVISDNYFGVRPPLGSNGGEIIRVGVSQHCEYNSFTQITSNFFEHCNGETEIISIKSGKNTVDENIFKECEGSVVLRHGDNNIVAGNYFLGNDKPATGGVRVINKGQIVINNIFYRCRGTSFRSPLAIMNGIPNSPAHRYVQVSNAQIMDNTFYECAPMSWCEGSDTERTLPPAKVAMGNNTFYNTRDTIIYKAWDDISGFIFGDNKVSTTIIQQLPKGFQKEVLPKQKLARYSRESKHSYPHVDLIGITEAGLYSRSGAPWFRKKNNSVSAKPVVVSCSTSEEIYKQLERKEPVILNLSGKEYTLNKPFVITKQVRITGNKNQPVRFITSNILSAFIITGNGSLSLQGLSIDGSNVKAMHFICSDSGGYAGHYNLSIKDCILQNFSRLEGCQHLIYAYRSMMADSIAVRNSSFINNYSDWLVMNEEKEDKGYYNAEVILISNNKFTNQKGVLLDVYRGGNDESTLGPKLVFTNNILSGCNTNSDKGLIQLMGVQQSLIAANRFTNCDSLGLLIAYSDVVRADHTLKNNQMAASGKIQKNKFVTEK